MGSSGFFFLLCVAFEVNWENDALFFFLFVRILIARMRGIVHWYE